MSDFTITWPRPVDSALPIPPRSRFPAAISASAGILSIDARCRNVDDGSISAGVTMSTVYRAAPEHLAQPYQWLILFEGLEIGQYDLQVTAYTREGQIEATRRFAVANLFAISISSHYDNENITDQKDDFLAYGEINARPLGLVKMTRVSDSAVIAPISTYSDHVVLQFWSAQFPSIPSGVYQLRAEDNVQNSIDTVGGLTVS